MTDYDDLTPSKTGRRGLSYTCKCGWVDWNHALPGGAKALKQQLDSETCADSWVAKIKYKYNGARAFMLYWGMDMGTSSFKTGIIRRYWVVRKGLTKPEKQAIAYYIFRLTSLRFERNQGSFPWNMVTDSSFSAEDLVSNIVGFYAAYNGKTQDDMRTLCGEVSLAESRRMYKENFPNGIGAVKNKKFDPLYYDCKECPKNNVFPSAIDSMYTISPGQLYREVTDNPRYTKHYDNWSNKGGRVYEIDSKGRIRS